MKILVTGSNGQLGREIIKQLDNTKHIIFCEDRNTLDITNFAEIDNYIVQKKPDVIINCAAYTKVDLCEEQIQLAYKVNSIGARNIAICAQKINAKNVYVSTDYVFDGNSSNAYKEDDKVGPTSIYGKSKLLGEEFTKSMSSKYFIIRTAWLYGDGHNFVKTMINLSKSHKEINVVNDQYGSPTYTKDLAKVILNLIDTEYYGIYHGTNNGTCTWYEFAKKIFEIENIDIKVNPITSDEFKSAAKRPTFSVLDNFMLNLINMDTFRNWEDAIYDYLKN
ncbi:MAG: dTDP-4-dehydrorhamnose reductase [Peptostreptococcaceae bacterium]